MLAYCGLDCESCPIHLASLEKDISRKGEMRIKIAEEMAKIYGIKMDPANVTDCDGCKSLSGILLKGCTDCPVRRCAAEKGFDTCAECADYPCEALSKHFHFDPASKERLDKLRN